MSCLPQFPMPPACMFVYQCPSLASLPENEVLSQILTLPHPNVPLVPNTSGLEPRYSLHSTPAQKMPSANSQPFPRSYPSLVLTFSGTLPVSNSAMERGCAASEQVTVSLPSRHTQVLKEKLGRAKGKTGALGHACSGPAASHPTVWALTIPQGCRVLHYSTGPRST